MEKSSSKLLIVAEPMPDAGTLTWISFKTLIVVLAGKISCIVIGPVPLTVNCNPPGLMVSPMVARPVPLVAYDNSDRVPSSSWPPLSSVTVNWMLESTNETAPGEDTLTDQPVLSAAVLKTIPLLEVPAPTSVKRTLVLLTAAPVPANVFP